MIHLTPDERAVVAKILARHMPSGFAAKAFGSRVHGRHLKPFSDLDLCIQGSRALDQETFGQLVTAFQESELAFKVDVVDWHDLSDEFRSLIKTDLTPMPKP